MKKISNLISEKVTNVTWLEKAINHAKKGRFPLTNSIAKELGIGNTITAIHITDPQGVMRLVSMQGSNKSISVMTKVSDWHIFNLDGIHRSGVACKVEGKVLLSSLFDAMTRPDERGRRWVNLPNYLYNPYKDFLSANEMYGYLWDESYGGENLDAKKKFLSLHFDLSLEFVKKNKNYFGSITAGEVNQEIEIVDTGYNEIVINNIKLLSIIYNKNMIEAISGGKALEKKLIASVPPGKAKAVPIPGTFSDTYPSDRNLVRQEIKKWLEE